MTIDKTARAGRGGVNQSPAFPFLSFVLCLLVSWLPILVPTTHAGTVKINGVSVTTISLGPDEYAPLAKVVAVLAGNSVKNETTKKVVVVAAGHRVVLTPENDVVIIDSSPRHLPLPIRWLTDDLYLPVRFIDIIFPKAASTIPAVPAKPSIDAITCTAKANSFLLAIKVDPGVPFEKKTISAKQYQLVIDASNKTPFGKLFNSGLVQKVEATTGSPTTVNIFLRSEGEIQVSAERTGLSVTVQARPRRQIRRIVVDPGHGGYDSGAVGPTGFQEKTANLDIALRLKGKLERALGVEVLMTRTTDVFVSLSDRTDFANRVKADLFVSCHNNAAPSFIQTHGLETYFLSEARTTWARAVEQRENASLRFEMADTNLARFNQTSLILADMAQNEFLKESSRLAELVQETTAPIIGITNRGINQAGFWVLRKSYMPAILVEGAFISNHREEQLLRSPDFRERMAEGICKGVTKFAIEYEQNLSRP